RQPDVALEPPEAALDAAEGLVVALLVLRRLRPGDPQDPVLHRDLEILARDAWDLDRAADLVVRLDNVHRRDPRLTRRPEQLGPARVHLVEDPFHLARQIGERIQRAETVDRHERPHRHTSFFTGSSNLVELPQAQRRLTSSAKPAPV